MNRLIWASLVAVLCVSTCAAMPMDSENMTLVVVPTPVTLDGSNFQLQIDTMEPAIWLRCTAVGEDPSCEQKKLSEVAGAKETTATFSTKAKVVYTTRTYSKLTVNGQTFTDVPVNVAYDTMYYLQTGIDGVFGLSLVPGAVWYDRNATATLTLGSAGSPVTINESPKALYSRIKQDTAVQIRDFVAGTAAMTCVRPVEGSTLGDCLPLLQFQGTADPTTTVHLNPATETIVIPSVALDAFAKAYLKKCSAIGAKPSPVVGFACPSDVKLPSVAIEISGWRFILQASEYSEMTGTGTVWVKLGAKDANPQHAGSILGLPFLRKYAVYFDANNKVNAVFCSTTAGTCEKVSSSAKSIISYFQQDSTTSSGSSGTNGGGASSSTPALSTTPAPTATSGSYLHRPISLSMITILSALSLLL